MRADLFYRVVLVGPEVDFDGLGTQPSAAPSNLQTTLCPVDDEGRVDGAAMVSLEPNVVVIGASTDRPFPVARQIRALCPRAQIVFLVPSDRLEKLRNALPFVPQLASAWTADTAGRLDDLIGLLTEAGRVSREQTASDTVLGRINQRLAGHSTSEQRRHKQLVLSERYLATILTQSPDGFLAADKFGTLIGHNDAASRLFAHVFERGEPTDVLELFPAHERTRLRGLLDQVVRGDALAGIEVRTDSGEKQGSSARYVELSFAPVQNEAGLIESVSLTARDISERKRSEYRQRLLIDELNHRVKNTLAIVQALAQQSFTGRSPPEDERSAFNARISALAAAHNLLTKQTWESIDLGELIDASVRAACGANADRHRSQGPEVTLPPESAVSFAMAVHELCTNAVKYGALSTEAGTVLTRWIVHQGEDGPRLLFDWIERDGPLVEPPTKRGFGTRMIEQGLAAELAAHVRLDFRADGVVCSLDAPLPGSVS